MTTVSDRETPPSISEMSGYVVSVTTRRVVLTVLALQALVLTVVGLDSFGLALPVVRPVVTVAYLTLVPGYLLLRLAGITDESRIETLLYSVGLSLISLMAVGVLANFALRRVGVARPVTEFPMVLSVGAFVVGLTWLYADRVEEDRWITVDTAQLTSPTVLTFAMVPLAGVYGGLILTRFGNNYLLLALYAALLVVPVLVVAGRIPNRLFPYVLWTMAFALLLQNTLSGHYMAWGDSPKEARLALDVVRTGYWEPALAPAFGSKYTMLRIVLLHPVYALFTDLKFVWEFKLVHPLVFSLTPVALYHAYERYVQPRTAFLSVFLYVSLFSYFVVLSRNTRTATALFFISLFAVLVARDRLPLDRRKLLAIVFVAGIVVSHYGVSYMFMLALALVIPLRRVVERFFSQVKTERPLTSPVFVVLYGTMLFAWYIYASPSAKAFRLVVGFATTFVERLTEQFLADPESTSATSRYLVTDFSSTTLDALRLYNVLIGGVIIVGLALTYFRLVRDEEIEFDGEYLAYATVALGIFGITFLPVERFNTARTYPTTLIFFAPFFVLGVREAFRNARRYVPQFNLEATYQVATLALVVFLALNVGFVSAVMTHEYSTNALVEKDRMMDDGAPPEKNYFYKQYPTVYGAAGTDWVRTTGANNSTMYRSGWPGGMRGAVGHSPLMSPAEPSDQHPTFRQRALRREMFENDSRVGEGYVFFNAFNHPRLGNVIRLPSGHFAFEFVRTSEETDHWSDKHLVYDNGGSRVYYGKNKSSEPTNEPT
jgi:uncharacterized membrane protein